MNKTRMFDVKEMDEILSVIGLQKQACYIYQKVFILFLLHVKSYRHKFKTKQ